MTPVIHLAGSTSDPVEQHLLIARDTLKERCAELGDRELALRNELDQVIGARTHATSRLTDLDHILIGIEPAPPSLTATPVAPAKTRGNAAVPPAASAQAKSEKAQARWQPVFDWVTAHKTAGTYSLAALTATFGSWAKNWSAAAKQYGVTITGSDPPPTGSACCCRQRHQPCRSTRDQRRCTQVGRAARRAAPRVHQLRRHLPHIGRRPAEQPLPALPLAFIHQHRTHTHHGRLTP